MERAGVIVLGFVLAMGGGKFVAGEVVPSGGAGYDAVLGTVSVIIGGAITAAITAYFRNKSERQQAEAKLVMTDREHFYKELEEIKTQLHEYRVREVEWSAERETLRNQIKAQEDEINELREEIKKLKDATQGGSSVVFIQ